MSIDAHPSTRVRNLLVIYATVSGRAEAIASRIGEAASGESERSPAAPLRSRNTTRCSDS